MNSFIGIILVVSIACAGLFYLYSEDGPINNLEKQKTSSTK